MGRRQVRHAIILLQGRASIVEMLRITKLVTLCPYGGRCARLPPNDLWAFACNHMRKQDSCSPAASRALFKSWDTSL